MERLGGGHGEIRGEGEADTVTQATRQGKVGGDEDTSEMIVTLDLVRAQRRRTEKGGNGNLGLLEVVS